MRIDSSGNIKIGTASDRFSFLTASTANLQIDGGVVFDPGSGNNVEIFNYRATDMLFGNSGGEDMRIDASGNVGIGTDSPSSYPVAPELVVDADTSGGITVKTGITGYGGVFFADGTTGNEQYRGFVQYNHNNGGSVDELLFGTSGATAMRINSSGNVGIGATTVDQHLHVEGAGTQAIKVETTADDYAIMQYICAKYVSSFKIFPI